MKRFAVSKILALLDQQMFLRFSVKQVDEDSRKPLGVFNAAYALLTLAESDVDRAD